MASTETLPDLGGQFSEDCPRCSRRECYVACRHLNEVMLAYYNFENYTGSERHRALTESILNLQDGVLSEICEFTFDICVQGSLKGFPCVQCENVCDSGTSPFLCGYTNITFDNCVTTEIDFQSTPALQAIYLSVINALDLDNEYEVNVKGVEDYANNVFSVVSSVVHFQSDTMYLDLTRALTADEETAWGFIKKTFPLPFGVGINLVTI